MLRPGLFLDRDGVINHDTGYLCDPKDFQLVDGIQNVLAAAKQEGAVIVVISNQSAVARGLWTYDQVQALNEHMLDVLRSQKLSVEGVLFCPHHPDSTNCLCRKPKSLLFERALALYGIDPEISVMVGDRTRDLIPAKKLGMETILFNPTEEEMSLPDTFDYSDWVAYSHAELLSLLRSIARSFSG